MATRTRQLYSSAWKSYDAHCHINTTWQPIPVTLQTLVSWITELSKRGLAPTTIKTYLAGIRSTLVDSGVEDLSIFHHPAINRLVTGIKRRHGEANRRDRLPVTRDILLQLLKRLNGAIESHAIIHAAYCLAFAGFLRAGEFTYLLGKRILRPQFC